MGPLRKREGAGDGPLKGVRAQPGVGAKYRLGVRLWGGARLGAPEVRVEQTLEVRQRLK